MMPHTVPNSPMYGVTLAVVARKVSRFSSRDNFGARRPQQRPVERVEALQGRTGSGSRPAGPRPAQPLPRREPTSAGRSARRSRPGRCRPAGCPPGSGTQPALPRTCCCAGRCRGSSTSGAGLSGTARSCKERCPRRSAEKMSRISRTPLESGEARRSSDTRSPSAPPPTGGAPWPWSNARTMRAHGNETSNPCKVRRWDSATGQPSTQANGCQTYDTMAVLAQIPLPAAVDGACRP